ncbi:phosphotransferase [Microlunatus flavus]|uniref:Predicted kinase, aminoglycoside phosphotransferase (APT) family n=1 Tax=Microlunatus flavus TaxID=1036181 RepID=A0A1H9MQF6_9ACTN|nr:phosphotransferase [Microlunatus flavus]SER25926.1 Predicted kinase, aminoglycoside phosphotransferase (APT) family [Microlunatus flavus]
MHEGQLDVTEDLVRALVADQLPAYADRPVRLLPQTGTVNAIARLGDDLAARFPLQPADPAAVRAGLEQEASAARAVLGRVRVPVPAPVALGEPGHGYPLPWSVQTWLPGTDAWGADPSGSEAFARDLARLVRDLRAVPTGGRTFVGERRTNRGGTIGDHDAWVRTCLERSAGLLDVPALTALWERLRDLPRGDEPDLTTHGDLIGGNVLVAGSGATARLAGLLDVGGTGPADPALDLVGAWHLLDDGPRAVFREALGVEDEPWARGVAWAYEQALGLVWYYRTTNPVMSAQGRRTLARILRADELAA